MRGRIPGDPKADRWSRHDWWGVVLDAPDARRLAEFYERITGWELRADEDDFVTLGPPEGVAYLAFQTQRDPDFAAPTWPAAEGRQQMMMHLDFEVSDLDAAVADAVAMGARAAEFQPQDDVRVMLDPAGHPFCLYAATDAD
ncbi:MAG TPA: VOC family protein [Stackebrandtia sp.]|uniref:VOC family protein n=1 Tax=Stackebrandtia sp. TaxID=2023065 RepID=UPI002D5D2D49|nr:VOC family protein [Stackebrandtia sp.]HZE39606.1 VOC family protein [Stackebrandtia sp.]